MKLIATLSLLFLVGCKCGHTTSDKEARTPTIEQPTLLKGFPSNKERLIGFWTDGSTDNATFEIQRDSIFYVDQLTAYKYQLKDDSITINFPDWIFSGKVSFSKDTLMISNEDGITKYWKFTN